jgi:hypothetical protein
MGNARRRRSLSSLLVLGASFATAIAGLPSSTAAAETDLYVVLHYGVDASVHGCWDDAEFRRNIAHRIGYDPFREDASIDVTVRVGGADNAVDGHVEWHKTNGLLMGERHFVAKDGNCVKLLTEMSFAVGLQIDLLRPKAPAATRAVASPKSVTTAAGAAASAAVAPPSTAAPDTPSATAPRTATEPAAAPSTTTSKPDVTEPPAAERRPREEAKDAAGVATPESASPWLMWVGLGPSLAWRISPAITGDARLFLGIRRADFSLEIAAEATYPSTERRWDGSGFRQSLLGGTLALCGHREWLSACALGRASAVLVSGLDVDKPRSPSGFVAQAGLRLAADFPLGGSWFLAAHLDGLGLPTRCTVVLNQATVWEMPRLGALAGLDILMRLP